MDFDRRCDILEDKNTVKAKQVNRQKCQDLTGKIQRYQGQAGENQRNVPRIRPCCPFCAFGRYSRNLSATCDALGLPDIIENAQVATLLNTVLVPRNMWRL